MLIGALGCNIAWGIIDAIFYLMGSFAERARNLGTHRAVRQAADPGEARRLIFEALPPVLASVLVPEELERARKRLQGLPEPSEQARLSVSDWRGACGVFLLVFLSTFPVSVPFLVMQSATAAVRVSNLVAVVMLFAAGFAYGQLVGRSPLAFGISMVALGSALVALTIALGG
jgi:VIT1/CCC1 family predicted Fe2+/Mn2+ transporter